MRRRRRNLQQARRRCQQIEIIASPAETYAIPDDVSVLYLFNPFRGATLKKVIQNLADSLQRSPRKLTLIYVLPIQQEDPFQHQPWLIKTLDRNSEGLRLAVYEAAGGE